MTRNIKVEKLSQQPVEEQMIELVERKGIGHPDSIADGLAESISCALCHEYKKRVGAVLHHNTDETQVVAGRSRPAFGGGEIIQPIYVLLSGRATRFFGEEEIPVDVIARRTAREYIRSVLCNIDVSDHVILDCKIAGPAPPTSRTSSRGRSPAPTTPPSASATPPSPRLRPSSTTPRGSLWILREGFRPSVRT